MPFEKEYDRPEPLAHGPCIHLRSKEIYVNGELRMPDASEVQYCHCWCNITQHVMGPDQSTVDLQQCNPNRDCYRTSY